MLASNSCLATDGDGYERHMGRWSRRLAPLLKGFAGIGGAVRVLDVGCGTGNVSFCLAQDRELVSAIGVDLSPAYIEHAIRRNGDKRLDFQVGDAWGVPFPGASFDHAISVVGLQFLPRVTLDGAEMTPVSRPGVT